MAADYELRSSALPSRTVISARASYYFTFDRVGVLLQSIVISVTICLSVCLSVCSLARISKTTCPDYAKFSAHVSHGCQSVDNAIRYVFPVL